MSRSTQIAKISEILMREWDPAEVSDVDVVKDEYDQYAEKILDMLNKNASENDIVKYLSDVSIKEFDRNININHTIAEKIIMSKAP